MRYSLSETRFGRGLVLINSENIVEAIHFPQSQDYGDFRNFEQVQPLFNLDDIFEGFVPRFQLKGSLFHLKVMTALLEIPRGNVVSYSDLCFKITGDKKSTRAVASSVAKNQIGYLVPCHRVLPKFNTPSHLKVGQFRWGSHLKSKFLNYEGVKI
jgi:O-6-methylguanine DNA methyltransferase